MASRKLALAAAAIAVYGYVALADVRPTACKHPYPLGKCASLGTRCASEAGRPFVPYIQCCGLPQNDCIPHVFREQDPDNKWGRFCQPMNATSIAAKRSGGKGGRGRVAGGKGTGKGGNSLAGMNMFAMPSFREDIDFTLSTAGKDVVESLEVARDTPTAFWLDKMYKAQSGNNSIRSIGGILNRAAALKTRQLTTFVVYNLPNRDCASFASNGEICCGAKFANGTCDHTDSTSSCGTGLATYKKNYIDPIAREVAKHCDAVPMALIIEPDSVGNLVTGLENPRCGSKATTTGYKDGIFYAVSTLKAACPKATLYLDGAHGGWLGWPKNLGKVAQVIKGLKIQTMIRGFAINISGYRPVGSACPSIGFCLDRDDAEHPQPDHPCCEDPCGSAEDGNVGHSEMNFAAALSDVMRDAMPGFNPKMVIDTSRNGNSANRLKCPSWCNVRGTGLGRIPTTRTGNHLVDAFMWIKTPGESDGCSEILPGGGKCNRFDENCASEESLGTVAGEPRAPEAGDWFMYQIQMLARNAKFGN